VSLRFGFAARTIGFAKLGKIYCRHTLMRRKYMGEFFWGIYENPAQNLGYFARKLSHLHA
jgi:hypothetical protein